MVKLSWLVKTVKTAKVFPLKRFIAYGTQSHIISMVPDLRSFSQTPLIFSTSPSSYNPKYHVIN